MEDFNYKNRIIIALFFLPFIVVAIIIEVLLATATNSYRQKKHFLEQAAPTTQILILGSSHTFFGIDPKRINQSTYNAAYASQSLFYDEQLFMYSASQMPHLQKVIIPISYFSYEFALADSEEYWRAYFYRNTYGFALEPSLPSVDWRAFSWFSLYGVPHSMQLLLNGLRDPSATMQSNGWDAKPTTSYCIDANLRAQYHTSIMRPERREEMIGALTSMITYAKERGIEVVLMSTPVCPDYYHATDWEKRLYVEKMTKKLAHQYRLPYLDLAQDDRFHADEFADADHLNAAGASRLSGILNEFLADGME